MIKLRDSHRWGRWGFNTTQDIGRDGDVMLTRWRLVQTPWFGVYIHRIFRADADLALHDHPWSFITCILRGGYDEDYARPQDRIPVVRDRRWGRWSVHRMDAARDAHRIDHVEPGTLTLVLVGRKCRRWGFWPLWQHAGNTVVDEWVHWREYLGLDVEPMVP